ncbi:hypothetical protein M8C21_002013 [Ambrosia artemisiifolia]|uniref:Uncharacterized protein n=1 Tax=Ambrosia artemisiifolia TaxID=4212 RepID=A0AAD5CT83_AMBAR|nr:hypothetical protein M8C21_002013 [Ambrosia artemisiifolia]
MTDISGYGCINFADSVAVSRKLYCIIHENDMDEICKLYEALCESSMLALPCREDIDQCSFCQYRARALETKTEKDIALLKLHHEAWSVHHVLHLLQGLIKGSSIIQILNQAKDWGLQLLTPPAEDAVDDHSCSKRSNVFQILGYFSMVGLLRVHCLLGNYQAGLDCLLPIDISQPGLYTTLIATRITTIYHYGFANLRLGSYAKAIQEFNRTLFEIKQPQQNAIQEFNRTLFETKQPQQN